MNATALATERQFVRKDLATIRTFLEEVKQNDKLAPLNLFGRKNPEIMLEYLDRRTSNRASVQLPIFVTPATFDGTYAEFPEGDDATILCVTKDVSLKGIGFTHDDPLESDYAVVTFDSLDAFTTLLLEVRWKNVESNRYSLMSGGRFVGILD